MANHQLGILFIHGIGEQPQGETLVGFSEPLLSWVSSWLGRKGADGAPQGGLQVHDAKLTPSPIDPSIPAFAEVKLHWRDDRGLQDSSWLIAESWWGGEVRRPDFANFAPGKKQRIC